MYICQHQNPKLTEYLYRRNPFHVFYSGEANRLYIELDSLRDEKRQLMDLVWRWVGVAGVRNVDGGDVEVLGLNVMREVLRNLNKDLLAVMGVWHLVAVSFLQQS